MKRKLEINDVCNQLNVLPYQNFDLDGIGPYQITQHGLYYNGSKSRGVRIADILRGKYKITKIFE